MSQMSSDFEELGKALADLKAAILEVIDQYVGPVVERLSRALNSLGERD